MSSEIYKYRRKLYKLIKENNALNDKLTDLEIIISELTSKNNIYVNMIQELTRSNLFYKKYFTIMHSNSSLSIDIHTCNDDISEIFNDNKIYNQKTKKIVFSNSKINEYSKNNECEILFDNSINSIEIN